MKSRVFELLYDGPFCSLNEYKSKHWTVLRRKINPIKTYSKILIKDNKIPKLKSIKVKVYSNKRHDLDNVVGTVKPFIDTLREMCLKDDNKKYWKSFHIDENPDVKKNCMLIRIEGEIEDESDT